MSPKTTFQVGGMSCAGCAAKIEKALQAAGAESPQVHFVTKTCEVSGDLDAQQVIKTIEDLGYQAHLTSGPGTTSSTEELNQLKTPLWVSLGAGVPLFVLSMLAPPFPYKAWALLILSAILVFGVGARYLTRAFQLLRQFDANMDTLIALGSLAAFFLSCFLFWQGSDELYFESSGLIIVFITVGKYLEERAKIRTTRSLERLAKLEPKKAFLLYSHPDAPSELRTHQNWPAPKEIPIEELSKGDVVLVPKGGKVPSDGRLVQGLGSLDTSVLTGESMPRDLQPGDSLLAGTVNVGTPFKMQVDKTGSETALAAIVQAVQAACQSKAPIQSLADKISRYFVPLVLLISFLTFAAWLGLGYGVAKALTAAIAVLVVSCPCALGLATPIAMVAGMGRAAELGGLIKNGEVLQSLDRCRTIMFDKTGTLTRGIPEVVHEVYWDQRFPITPYLATLARHSTHPLSSAIARHIRTEEVGQVKQIEEIAGLGLKGTLRHRGLEVELFLGRDHEDLDWDNEEAQKAMLLAQKAAGPATPVVVAVAKRPVGAYFLRDQLRHEAVRAIDRLKHEGMSVVLASGDRHHVVEDIARRLDIQKAQGELSPLGKAEWVEQLAKEAPVLMVGDGINDAPALVKAQVGIALSSGADLARDVAGISLRSNSIHRIVDLVVLAKKTFRIVKQNLAFAFFYNALLIPIAAFGGLRPMHAALAMALSSLSVVLNGARLHRTRL